MLQDLRLALRRLAQAPGFTTVAVLTLALGIGVNATMLGVVEALLFRGNPFPTRDRLVRLVGQLRQGAIYQYSAIELDEIRAQSTAFESYVFLNREAVALAEPDRPTERIGGVNVSDGVFATLGITPFLGRAFTPEEFQPGRNQVVLLSHAFWLSRFGGDRTVLGRTLRLDGENVTVVGVMPPSFDYRKLWGAAAFWRPLNFTKDQLDWRDYRAFWFIGRLRASATPERAGAELASVAAVQQKQFPESYTGLRYRAVPLDESLTNPQSRQISWLLLALSGFVLLIACANLANLQLARATARLREFAIRAALGCSRRRLLAQQLLESLVLAFIGGLVGLLVALALGRVIANRYSLGGEPLDLAFDAPVLVATFLVALLAGILFGLAPAWFAARADVNSALKQQSRGSSAGRGHHRVRQTLIVAEVALALVLLAGAGIIHRGFSRLTDCAPGWDVDRIIVGDLPVPERRIDTDDKRTALFRKIQLRLANLPGVEQVAITSSLPIDSYNGDRQVLVEGQTAGDASLMPAAFHVMATAEFFPALGIRLVEGRLYNPGLERGKQWNVVVINESLARRLWPKQSAVGRRLGSMDSGKAYWAEVVGVVRDVDSAIATQAPTTPYVVYKPLENEPWSYVRIVLRSPAPGGLAEALRRAVAEVDPDLALASTGTVREIADWQQRELRLAAEILAWFAVLGLVLASIGLYGVVSHVVAQRRGEFGIRLALGAQPADVFRLVLLHGLRWTALGLLVGVAGSFALGRLLGSWLPRLAHADPLVLATVAAVLLVVAMLSCAVPARRATRADPLEALRAE